MQVICTDGSVLTCDRFEAIDSGVLLFGSQQRQAEMENEDEEEDDEPEADAFVPLHQLRFVLPEGIQPLGGGQSTARQATQGGTQQVPPMSGPPQQGQVPPSQTMSGQQTPPQQRQGQQPSQSGPGYRQ